MKQTLLGPRKETHPLSVFLICDQNTDMSYLYNYLGIDPVS